MFQIVNIRRVKANKSSRPVAMWTNAAGRVTGQAWEKVDYRDDPHLKINPTIIDFVSVDV